MADPLGIIGVVGVAVQLSKLVADFGLDWKDAPKEAKSFKAELEALMAVLSVIKDNIPTNNAFIDAFEDTSPALLTQLGGPQMTPTKTMITICKAELVKMLDDLRTQSKGRRLGWRRLKGAILSKRTRAAVEDLQRRCQLIINSMIADGVMVTVKTHQEAKESMEEEKQWQCDESKVTAATKTGVDALQHQQQQQKHREEMKEFLDWLGGTDYSEQYHDFFKRWQPGTGQWLLDSREYDDWCNGGKRTLFCPGIPGAGKTTITSMVIDNLLTRHEGHIGKAAGIAYLYCNFKRHAEQSLRALLSSLIRQLILWRENEPLPATARDLYDYHRERKTKPSTEDIQRILQAVCSLYPRTFLVVDALDECQTTEGCQDKLIKELRQLRDMEGSTVSIFATSRHLPKITEQFQGDGCATLEIRAADDDVKIYLEKNMVNIPFIKRHSELHEEIKTAIVGAVRGMFLLAQLHLGSLQNKKTTKALKRALDALPSGSEAYDQAYSDAMKRVEEPLGMDVLGWIVYACRPLHTEELRHALGVEEGDQAFDPNSLPDLEDMVSACAGLVTVDEKSGVIRLVHYTTQEYFERTKSNRFPAMEDIITNVCVTYLSLGHFDDGLCKSEGAFAKRVETYRLYGYASQYWGHHARQTSRLLQPVLDFLLSKPHTASARQAMFLYKKRHREFRHKGLGLRGIHLAAHFGVTSAVKALLDQGCPPDCKDSEGSTPLWWAVNNGQMETARLLLATKGVDPNRFEGWNDFTPLLQASSRGYTGLVELLLNTEGVAINQGSGISGKTPLLCAAENGHQPTAKLLLERGADPKRPDKYGNLPILAAAKRNNVDMVKLLVDSSGTDPDTARDSNEELALCLAAEHNCEETVQFLVQRGVFPNAKNRDDRTPLAAAAARGHESIVRWLLRLDNIEPDATDWAGMTPLLEAARNGFPRIADLIAARVNLTPKNRSALDEIRLLAASKQGDIADISQLLARGISIEEYAQLFGKSLSVH